MTILRYFNMCHIVVILIKLEMMIKLKNYLSRGWDVDECVDVDICEGGHQELAVKPEEMVGNCEFSVCQFCSKTCP